MPPRKRTEPIAEVLEESKLIPESKTSFLREGQIVHIILGGRTIQYREILGWDDHFLKIRSDVSVAPQTEIILIPFAQIEAIGLTDER